MGCVSSKILAKSGSFQEKVNCSLGQSFQRSSAIEEIILSTSKSNGDQFLALLRTSTSSANKAKEPEAAAAPPVAEPAAKIETVDVSELLAGLEEEESCTAEEARERRQSSRDGSPAPSPAPDGRARSFRTVEEFDAIVLLTQQQQQTQSESGSSSGRATALATEQEELGTTTTPAAAAAAAATAEAEVSGGSVSSKAAAVGAKRRARARQLGELNVPAAAFDFSIYKSGSLRDWLRQGGQIFSPGSYVTPRFGTSPPVERSGAYAGEQHALFDPELVAQFERAMEQLSEEEGRVLDEILEALELEAAEKDSAAAVVGRVGDDQPAAVLVQQVGGA